MLSGFDITINIIEAIITVLMVKISHFGNQKNNVAASTISIILIFSIITLNNLGFIEQIPLLLEIIFILTLYGVFSHRNFLNSFFISVIFLIILLTSNTLALISNNLIYFLFNINLSYSWLISFSKVIYFIIGIIISKIIYKNNDTTPKNQLYFNISLFLLVILYVSIFTSIFKDKNTNWQIYLQLIILIAFTICICMLFRKATRDQYEKYQLYLLYKEQEVQNKNYEQLEKSINEISSLRHDMKHILNLIKYHNDHNNKNAIYTIIDQQLNSINNVKEIISSGSQSLDYILYQNSNLIKEQNIQLVCNHFVINEKAIDEIDYFTILGNLFDNALENCKANPDKKIIIDRGIKNGNYYFKISNTIDTPVLKTNPSLETTKTDSKYHGIGINNIRKIIKKYNGNIFFDDDGVFFTCVMVIPNIDQEVKK